ncbi:MAG: hypothetical protein RR060_03630, partial [Victivallaceae bacterium]
LSDIFTIALNLSGNCGLSMPLGLGEESHLPVGGQFIAPSLGEEALFKVCRTVERKLDLKEFVPHPGMK